VKAAVAEGASELYNIAVLSLVESNSHNIPIFWSAFTAPARPAYTILGTRGRVRVRNQAEV
jgi:hypothetical protein